MKKSVDISSNGMWYRAASKTVSIVRAIGKKEKKKKRQSINTGSD